MSCYLCEEDSCSICFCDLESLRDDMKIADESLRGELCFTQDLVQKLRLEIERMDKKIESIN